MIISYWMNLLVSDNHLLESLLALEKWSNLFFNTRKIYYQTYKKITFHFVSFFLKSYLLGFKAMNCHLCFLFSFLNLIAKIYPFLAWNLLNSLPRSCILVCTYSNCWNIHFIMFCDIKLWDHLINFIRKFPNNFIVLKSKVTSVHVLR